MEEVEFTNKPQESTPVPQSNLAEVLPTTRVPPNLHVTMPPSTLQPTEQASLPSATLTQPQSSYFPSSIGSVMAVPPASPLTTPSTPKVKLSLADYRARRASGMVTPSTPVADPLSQHTSAGETFTAPPPPSHFSVSPDQKPRELPPS